MSEGTQRSKIVGELKHSLGAIAVENGFTHPGTPDIAYLYGWIECKWLRNWPVRATTKVRLDHPLTTQQRNFAVDWHYRGGVSWVMLSRRQEWLLFTGPIAAAVLGYSTKEELIVCAYRYWPNGMVWKELIEILQKHKPQHEEGK